MKSRVRMKHVGKELSDVAGRQINIDRARGDLHRRCLAERSMALFEIAFGEQGRSFMALISIFEIPSNMWAIGMSDS